ncbi:MAG: hypothetical protein ACRYG8_16345 [Janthinobacterium lividum]
MAMEAAVDVARPPAAMAVTATFSLIVLHPTDKADGFADVLPGPQGLTTLTSHGFDRPWIVVPPPSGALFSTT